VALSESGQSALYQPVVATESIATIDSFTVDPDHDAPLVCRFEGAASMRFLKTLRSCRMAQVRRTASVVRAWSTTRWCFVPGFA
jgi:hypothetical protein